MTSSTDYRPAGGPTVRPGDAIRVVITKGRASDRGTFATTVRQHPRVAGLLVADVPDREIVVQRPDGAQPHRIETSR